MIATLSSRGQIVIPQAVRERCGLREGDHFVIEDDPETQVVILRKVKDPEHWFEIYMQCPHSFSVPALLPVRNASHRFDELRAAVG